MFVIVTGVSFFLFAQDFGVAAGAIAAVGAILAMALATVVWVNWRAGKAKLAMMTEPRAQFVLSDDAVEMKTDRGSGRFPWATIRQIWKFPQVWLVDDGPQPIPHASAGQHSRPRRCNSWTSKYNRGRWAPPDEDDPDEHSRVSSQIRFARFRRAGVFKAPPPSRPRKPRPPQSRCPARCTSSNLGSTPAAAARASSRRPAPATRAACGSPIPSPKCASLPCQMLGATLVTVQTGPAGKQVNRIYVEDGSDIDKEFLYVLVDRSHARIAFVVSTEGGVNIEEVAHKTPEKIVSFSVDPATGIMADDGRTAAKALDLPATSPSNARRW